MADFNEAVEDGAPAVMTPVGFYYFDTINNTFSLFLNFVKEIRIDHLVKLIIQKFSFNLITTLEARKVVNIIYI